MMRNVKRVTSDKLTENYDPICSSPHLYVVFLVFQVIVLVFTARNFTVLIQSHGSHQRNFQKRLFSVRSCDKPTVH